MRISDLVNKVEDFRFEFDGEVLEGKYHKYKTTTPQYLKALSETIPPLPESGTDEEKAAATEVRNAAALKASMKMIADTIVSWNALDEQEQPIAPSLELFEQLPNLFTEKFLKFFNELREGNPTNGNGLPTG